MKDLVFSLLSVPRWPLPRAVGSGRIRYLRAIASGTFSFADSNTATAVGESGTILYTPNGGSIWAAQPCGTTHSFFGVWFADANTGTPVGAVGTIVPTTNGGISWIRQSGGTGWWLTGVCFTDANTGTAVGGEAILRTTNSGAGWTAQSSGTTHSPYSVCFTEANTGTAVGSPGTILRTTTGGVVGVEDDIHVSTPCEVALLQTYPNPFNPSTGVRCTLPVMMHVTLKVYNVLGQEVATLVNEVKQPGSYEVTWRAEGVAGGVYFARLAAGAFYQTTKTLLLR
jgi:hypothetical protein